MISRALLAAVVLSALLVGGCSGSSSPAPTSPPSSSAPSPTPPTGPKLVTRTFLGLHFLAPRSWHGQRERTSSTDGQITYTAPDRRGRMYVEVNGCIACVDQGDVRHGTRTYVPAPAAVIAQYDPLKKKRVNRASIDFTRAAPKGYVAPSRITVRKADGQILGYVVVETTFPEQYAATADQITRSLAGRGL